MVHYRLAINNPFMQATNPNIRGQLMRDIQWADGVLTGQRMTMSYYVYTDYGPQPPQRYVLKISKTAAGDLDIIDAFDQ